MRILTNNANRTVHQMLWIFEWCSQTFGPTHDGARWSYGKEPDFTGSTFVNGPWDIEWINFAHDVDATLFLLKWS